MSEYAWSDVTLEGVGCVVLLVFAYKLYRMRVSTSSNCCDGALLVESENPGNDTPRILKSMFGAEAASKGADVSIDLENPPIEHVLTTEAIQAFLRQQRAQALPRSLPSVNEEEKRSLEMVAAGRTQTLGSR